MKRKAEDLGDYLQEFVEIRCTSKYNCPNHAVTEPYGAEERLFAEGWRATQDNCYCPDCAKKYLKQ